MPRTLDSPFLDAESFSRDDASAWDAPAVPAAESSADDSLNAFELFDEVRELWTQEEQEGEPDEGESPLDTDDQSEAFEHEDDDKKCSDSGFGIIGNDDRNPVADSVAVPFRWICQLWVRSRDSNGKVTDSGGTGVLVSPRHVLTCAHVVRNDKKDNRNQWVSHEAIQIRVTPGRDGGDRPFGTYDVKLPAQVSPWWNPRTMPHGQDYALLTLDKAIGDETFKALGGKKLGYWGSTANGAGSSFRRVGPDVVNGRIATTAGYPKDKGRETPYVTTGQIQNAHFRSRTMNISADACQGQSGSPIWLTIDNNLCLVGLMVAIYRGTNMALRVTDEMCGQLRKWMKGASDACAPRAAATSGTVRPQPELESPGPCRCHEHETDDLETFADEYSAGEPATAGEYQLDEGGDLEANEGWDEAAEFEEPEDEFAFEDRELDPGVLDIAERTMLREAPFLEGQVAKSFTTCFSAADIDRVKKSFVDNTAAAGANDGDRCSCIVMLNVALGKLLPLPVKPHNARSTSNRSVSMGALSTASIETAMQQLGKKRMATGPTIMNFFDRRDRTAGTLKPERLKASVQDKVLALSKAKDCWFAYGLSIMDGYHSVLLLVDRTGGSGKIYWLDQFSTGVDDDVTSTLDQRITERTQRWWQHVMDTKHKGYNTTIRIWPLRKPRTAS